MVEVFNKALAIRSSKGANMVLSYEAPKERSMELEIVPTKSGEPALWSRNRELNPEPMVYDTIALPVKLFRHIATLLSSILRSLPPFSVVSVQSGRRMNTQG
jgi:hypothetical protein